MKYKPAKVLEYQQYVEEQKRKKEAEQAKIKESGQKEDVVFDMETGEVSEKQKEMDVIAEGDGEDQN